MPLRILALDSAMSLCSVAILHDGRVLASRSESRPRGQAECLVPMIEAALSEAKLSFPTIDRIAVTVGPGHFTGLRIGLATARGLAIAAGRPLIGVTTLEAVAAAVPAQQRKSRTLVVALDSKRAELYVQSFTDELAPLDRPAARLAADYAAAVLAWSPLVIVGDGAPALLRAVASLGGIARASSAPPLPSATVVAILAASRAVPALHPGPLYLHPAEVTMPAAGAGA